MSVRRIRNVLFLFLLLYGATLLAQVDKEQIPERNRPRKIAIGVTAGINEGISFAASVWRYGRVEMSLLLSDYIRPYDVLWRILPLPETVGPHPCLQVFYRQYWPGSIALYSGRLSLSGGVSGGPVVFIWSERNQVWGKAGGPFITLLAPEARVSLQAELLFYHTNTFKGRVGIGPAATLYYHF